MTGHFQGRNLQDFLNEFHSTSYMKLLNMKYVAHGNGWAEMALPWSNDLVGDPETGVVASGAIFSMMDTVSGMALFSTLPEFEPMATLDLRIDYLRPAKIGTTIYGRADVIKITRRICFIRGIAHDGDIERPVANVTGTFMRTSRQ